MVALGVAMLFGHALAWLGARRPDRRPVFLCLAGVCLLAELVPAPLTLYRADVPAFYQTIARDTRPVRVLELPFGVRDGTKSHGNFTARSQFFQTVHHKPLIGGYLSRVSRKRVEEVRREPLLDVLISLSEGREIDALTASGLTSAGPRFLEGSAIGYVVIDRERASAALRDFAISVLRLRRIDGDAQFDLYAPDVATARADPTSP